MCGGQRCQLQVHDTCPPELFGDSFQVDLECKALDLLVFGPCSFARSLSKWDLIVVRVTAVAADFRNMNPATFSAESVNQRD